METLEDGIARANDAARKARILRIGTDLMRTYMQEVGPLLNISLHTAVLAGEGGAERDMVSILISTALGICGNTVNCVMEILAGMEPKLKNSFKKALPSVLSALQDEPVHGTVMVMDGNGVMRDGELAAQLQEMFAERYAPRARGEQP